MTKVSIIASLVPFFYTSNSQVVFYKKTANDFRRKYGIDIAGAPMVFKKNGILWKFQYVTDVFRGRKFESAMYVPMVNVGNKYESLSRTDINV